MATAPALRVRTSPEQEASQQFLNKLSKLEVAQQAVLTQDLHELAAADRAKVKRLEDKLVFPGQPQANSSANGDTLGDIIVCDDYNITHVQPTAPSQAAPAAAPAQPAITTPAAATPATPTAAASSWKSYLLPGVLGAGLLGVGGYELYKHWPTAPASVVTPDQSTGKTVYHVDVLQPDGTYKEVDPSLTYPDWASAERARQQLQAKP